MKLNIRRKIGIYLLVCSLTVLGAGSIFVQAANFTNNEVPGYSDISNAGTPPEISAATAILIDASTGQILYQKNPHEKRYPASTTKTMTALLAIENLDMESTLTIDNETSKTKGSSIDLKDGEYMLVRDLVYGLMLESGNDAAIALAKGVSGSIEGFAELMNKKASQAGALNTHFNNPNGLPDENHYTTAYDLAMIAKAALNHQMFRQVITTAEYNVLETNKSKPRRFVNGNRMLWDTKNTVPINGEERPLKYDGITGVKTGFTNDAGLCLIASAQRNGHEIIGVVLGSESTEEYEGLLCNFRDMIMLMDYGFSTYSKTTICKADDIQYKVKVKGSDTRKVPVSIPGDINIILPTGAEMKDIKTEIELEKKFDAPLKKEQVLGTLTLYYGDSVLCTEDLIAKADAPARTKSEQLIYIAKMIGLAVLGLIIFLIILILVLRFINRKRRRKRQAASKKQTSNVKQATSANQAAQKKQSPQKKQSAFIPKDPAQNKYQKPDEYQNQYNTRKRDFHRELKKEREEIIENEKDKRFSQNEYSDRQAEIEKEFNAELDRLLGKKDK